MMGDFSQSNVDSRLDSVRELSSHDQDDDSLDNRFIVIGKKNKSNQALHDAIKVYGSPVVYSDTGLEFINDSEYNTVFVLDNFEGDIFSRLNRAGCRILGPPVVIHCAQKQQRLPCSSRPLYSMLMHKLVLCFTGFRVKEDLSRLATLVHHMGGSIRKDFSSRVTHLVANCTSGEKYRVAVSMGTAIMREDWVHKAWEYRDMCEKSVMDIEQLRDYKMSPFCFSILSFMGFSKEEQREMERTTVEYGGSVVEAGSPQCSHLVVDEHTIKQIPFETNPRLHVIKQEWFWASIQMDACADESMYTFEMPQQTPSLANGPSSSSSVSGACAGQQCKDTPKSLSSAGNSKSRKRKRLRENLAQLAHEGEVDTPMYKRRSSEITHMSISASFLDDTKSPDISNQLAQDKPSSSPSSSSAPSKEPLSARQQTVLEFFQTEKNYAGILHTIIKTFKEEIEKPDQPGGPLLDPTDVKIIFGKIPLLYDVHMRIRDELSEMVVDWSEDGMVGDVILKHADALMKSYPPFVNFFEDTKETLEKCIKSKPRFHAFLKVCQSKPECGRQSLKELLIRPVQRLPSILLLLKDITKRTEQSHPDHARLGEAIKALEEVMTHINEDRRKTEGHQVMFNIVNDIENCPPNLLSSHRKFIAKIDVLELTNELGLKGEPVSLFIFSDSLEMCKRRVKVRSTKSPGGVTAHGAKTPQKAYKHIDVVQLSCIKRVLDIVETPDCKNVFALVTKKMSESEKLFAFVIMDDSEKPSVLDQLSRAICNVLCRTDYTTLQATVDATTLNLDTTDLGNKTLSKAATRFGKRVSRAFSFNKTPRKLKRAMSSMTQIMSPFSRRESGMFAMPGGGMAAIGGGTPSRGASNMAAMRLASVNDLTRTTNSPFLPTNLCRAMSVAIPDESAFHNENLYSDLVDSVSLGCRTPSMARRRDTLAELDEVSISSNFTNISDISAAMAPPPPALNNHSNRRRETLATGELGITNQNRSPKAKRSKRLSTMLSGDDSPSIFAAPPPMRTPTLTPRSATIGYSATKRPHNHHHH